MIAFEISVNGHHVQTISVGETGLLSADVMWHRIENISGQLLEQARLSTRGLEGNAGDSVAWQEMLLSTGDAVTIRIVETDHPGDPPDDRIPRDELDRRRQP